MQTSFLHFWIRNFWIVSKGVAKKAGHTKKGRRKSGGGDKCLKYVCVVMRLTIFGGWRKKLTVKNKKTNGGIAFKPKLRFVL